jgi:succinate dehydrogenase/fumarate reductase cytochrome b subunit
VIKFYIVWALVFFSLVGIIHHVTDFLNFRENLKQLPVMYCVMLFWIFVTLFLGSAVVALPAFPPITN